MRRQAADAAERGERARTFGEGGLRNLWRRGSRSGVLSGRHGSMVAKAVVRANRLWKNTLRMRVRGLTPINTDGK